MAAGITDFLRRMVAPKRSAQPGQSPHAEPVVHKGYEIRPEPRQQDSLWLVAGTITKLTDEGERTHYFLRADSHSDRDSAIELSIFKAKQMIDLEGERIFDKPSDRR